MKRKLTYREVRVILIAILSGVYVLIGLVVIIPSGGGVFCMLFTLAIIGINVMFLYQTFGKHYAGPEINIEEEELSQRPVSPPPAESHDHIPSTALDAKRRLEQLESLKTAGLISDREYQQKRQEILHDL